MFEMTKIFFLILRCDGKSMCTFSVGQPDFPDPCPGTKKYVTAMWYCIPASKSKVHKACVAN